MGADGGVGGNGKEVIREVRELSNSVDGCGSMGTRWGAPWATGADEGREQVCFLICVQADSNVMYVCRTHRRHTYACSPPTLEFFVVRPFIYICIPWSLSCSGIFLFFRGSLSLSLSLACSFVPWNVGGS
jgi:hypothetical protein